MTGTNAARSPSLQGRQAQGPLTAKRPLQPLAGGGFAFTTDRPGLPDLPQAGITPGVMPANRRADPVA